MSTIVARDADEWRDLASRSFVPLAFQRADESFTATLDRRELGADVSLSGIRSEGVVIERTTRLAAAAASDDVHISLQLGSTGRLVQHDRVAAIGPGVVTIAETHVPFVLDYSARGQRHLVLQVDRRRLRVDDDLLRLAGGRAVAGPNPARDAYIAYVTSLLAAPADRAGATVPDDADAEVLCTLARAMLQTAFDRDHVHPLTDDAAFVALSAFIREHLASPLLTPDRLAVTHFMSRRRLYAVFAQHGTTPADAIRAARIDAACRRLHDPAERGTTIAEIAFAVGFADVTTFTRAFRRTTGEAPREWRDRMRYGEGAGLGAPGA